MSCYHPIAAYPDYSERTANGKVAYKLFGKYDPDCKLLDPKVIAVPCGRCIGCRLDYSRQWADRMVLELEHTGKGIFVTLTYNNDNVPQLEDDFGLPVLTLDKTDLQLFFKRLRKRFKGKEIRYYAAGEYGSNTFRPHYHAIIFGLCLEDFPDRVLIGKNELGQLHYSSPLFESIWSNGFVVLSDVSWKTCAYVSRYVQKKVFAGTQVITDVLGAEPEFSVMSRRPGIGAKYLEDHPDLFDYSMLYPKGKPEGVRIPKYFMKKLSLIDEERYANIMSEKRKFSEDRNLLKLQQTDLSFVELLEVEENQKLLKSNALKRPL